MSTVIAILALVFTIGSFWWINARPGRLLGSRPAEFSMIMTPRRTRFRIPVVIYNTGARTQVVESLRLAIVGSEVAPLEWITTRDRLRPESDERTDFSSPFSIDGRRAVKLFAEFGEESPVWYPDPGTTHLISIDARILGSKGWLTVARFPLAIPTNDLGSYIARTNPPVMALDYE